MTGIANNGGQPWYVMCHLNPEMIEILLRKESGGEFGRDGESPSPFRYYVPYLYMPVARRIEVPAEGDDASEGQEPRDIDGQGLRSDFRHFVFIQAPPDRVDAIVNSEWNRSARLHLYYYRDHEHRAILARDEEVQRLMDTFRDKNMGFFIGQPIDDFSEGDEVLINTGAWAGKEGIVIDKRYSRGQLTMVVGMNVFNRTMSINFTDLKTGDVTFKDADKARLLSHSPVAQLEDETIDILSRRQHGLHPGPDTQDDATRLRRLALFDRILVEAHDPDYLRVLALRLMGASLRQSVRRKALEGQVRQLLRGQCPKDSYGEAYLNMALFVATREAGYRDAAKAYRNSHPDCPDALRRFLSIAKKMKARPSKTTI